MNMTTEPIFPINQQTLWYGPMLTVCPMNTQCKQIIHYTQGPEHNSLVVGWIEVLIWPSVADAGFPVGGVDLVGGGVDSRGSYVSKILYVKTKELGPLGGRAPGAPP